MGSLGPHEIGMMIVVALLYALPIIAMIVVAWLLVKKTRVANLAPPGSGQETALDALKRRYAAGDITREQYQAMRRELEE